MATRKIRLENGKSKRIVSNGKTKILHKADRTHQAQVLIRKLQREEIDVLNEEQAKLLIDHCQGLQDQAESLGQSIGEIKGALLGFAKHADVKTLKAEVAQMSVRASTTSTVGSATKLVALLKKMKKVKAADAILSIKIGEAKKYLGEQTLRDEKLYSTETSTFGSVTIKPL